MQVGKDFLTLVFLVILMNSHMSFKKIIDSIKEKTISLFYRDKEKITITAKRDWFILLSIFSLGIVFFTLVGLSLFMKINYRDTISRGNEQSDLPEIITKERLNERLNIFDEKEKQLNKLLLNRPVIIDPS